MNLFTKYNRFNITVSILVFLAGSLAFYFVLRYILVRQLDEALRTERNEIRQYVNEHNQLPEIVNTKNQQIAYYEVGVPFTDNEYASAKAENKHDDDWLRQLIFGITAGGKNYRIVVSKSGVETEDLLQLILLIAAGMIALVLLAGYFINRVIIQRLWKPFYNSINNVEQYNLTRQQPLHLPAENIEEFNLLNESLNKMTRTWPLATSPATARTCCRPS